MKLVRWMIFKYLSSVIRKHEKKAGKLIKAVLKQPGVFYTRVNISDYLKYEYHSYDDDLNYKQPNESCHYIVVCTEEHELIFLVRGFLGDWNRFEYGHPSKVSKVYTMLDSIVDNSRKIKQITTG